MCCSSCETLIDRYIEGTLPQAQLLAVRAHLESCPQCEAVHRELRIVDGLLATARRVELPPNFTFAVMAEARSMPLPSRRSSRFWPALVTYLVAGWALVAVAATLFGGKTATILSSASPALREVWNVVAAFGSAVHSAGAAAPVAVSVVVTVLCLDAMLFAALFYFYRRVRPRLAERLAAVDPEAS